MSENCTHNCSTCGQSCSSRTEPQSLIIEPHPGSHIKHIIAVVSGKGGVGKSSVTCQLAVLMQRMGCKTAILDADITGPSIPKAFGVHKTPEAEGDFLYPDETETGIKIMSVNLLLDDETTPVLWRGPIIAGTVKQFYSDIIWGDIDYMFIDCPPGTGDVPLTIFQSIPIDGVVVVTTPQDLVSVIVGKAVHMADSMNIPVIGMIENMSYFKCPDCGNIHYIYGKSNIDKIAEDMGIKNVAKMPIDPHVAEYIDAGRAEELDASALDTIFKDI